MRWGYKYSEQKELNVLNARKMLGHTKMKMRKEQQQQQKQSQQ